MPKAKAPATRSPRGVLTDKPIALRLMPSEMKAVKDLSAAEGRSLAGMARLLVLASLPVKKSRSS